MSPDQHDLLRAWVSIGSDVASELVIPGEESGPRPKQLYASVTEITDDQVGEQNRTTAFDGTDTQGYFTTNRVARVSIQFYRDGATEAARQFINWIGTDLGRLEADRRNFRIDGKLSQRDLSLVVADDWEDRAGVDIMVKYTDTYHQNLGRIDEVDITFADSDSGQSLEISISRG